MARLTLTAGESVGLSSGNYTIYGTATGTETVTVSVGTVVTLDASFNRGGDVITLTGTAASYSAVRSGSSIILTDASGGSVTIPVGHATWIGLQVLNREGVVLGTVRDLMATGPQTVLVLQAEENGQAVERMIPFVSAFVDQVDMAARRITVDWQPDY